MTSFGSSLMFKNVKNSLVWFGGEQDCPATGDAGVSTHLLSVPVLDLDHASTGWCVRLKSGCSLSPSLSLSLSLSLDVNVTDDINTFDIASILLMLYKHMHVCHNMLKTSR